MLRQRRKSYKAWLRGDGPLPRNWRERLPRRPQLIRGRVPLVVEPRVQNADLIPNNVDPNEILPLDDDAMHVLGSSDASSQDDSQSEINTSDSENESENDEENLNHACDCLACQDELGRNRFKETSAYAEKHDLNQPLSPGLNVTKFEALLMMLTMAMRHGMTAALVNDLVTFVNKILGYTAVGVSNYIFSKLFSVESSLQYHFICDNCDQYLGEYKSFNGQNETVCTYCEHVCNVKPTAVADSGFFVTMSVKQQMQELLDRVGNFMMPRGRREGAIISDVQDGKVYRALCEEGQPLSNPNALSLTIGTDGGQVFKTSYRNSMWPVQIVCNEIIPSERFRPENIILAGLWFGKNSPPMTAFLKPLSSELQELEQNGVKRRLQNDEEVICPVYTIMCVCDAVAKAKIQNIAQFNGYYGCGYCLQSGTLDESGNVKYPYSGAASKLRSHQSTRNAMTIAQETSLRQKGVKGLSALLLFPYIHLVFGIPIDYLHAVLIGVTKKVVNIWFDETYHKKRYYLKKFEPEIDTRLSLITPPSRTATRPKLISKRSVWKGKDWLHFLLHFGIPCLDGILPNVYLQNFKDLSNGIFLLLQDSISREDLNAARGLLDTFVIKFNQLYGLRNMVYNVHLVTHLSTCVEMTGPLQMYSAFAFEGGIGSLVKLVKGTQSVAPQICRKFLMSKSLPYLLTFHNISPSVQEFCESIVTFSRTQKSVSIGGVTLLGKQQVSYLNEFERQLLLRKGHNIISESVSTFYRALYKGKVITSKEYSRQKKTNDTCIQLNNGLFGVVDKILYLTGPETCLIIFIPLRICDGYEITNHIFTCAADQFNEKIIVTFEDFSRKCIIFPVGQKTFVSFRPNITERDL